MSKSLTFSKLDADRILRRAAEIEGSEDSRPITLDELRSIAGEAGFGAQAVERAIAEAQQASASNAFRPVQRRGVVRVNMWTVREIPVQISSEQLMQAVRLFQPYREGPAQVKLEDHQITWRDRKGLRFAIVSAGGVTEIRVFVSKLTLRRGRWIGWVKTAADRLESIVYLVESQEPARAEVLGQLPA